MEGPKGAKWGGYAPWAETVRECRREFVRVARSFRLMAWHPRRLGITAPRPHDSRLHRTIAGWRGAHG